MTNKLTFLTIFLFITVAQVFAQNTSPRQGQWRWRADNGTEATAWTEAVNTSMEISSYDNIRLRVELYDNQTSNTGSYDNLGLYLFYSTDQTNWKQIKTTVDNNQAFTISLSNYFANLDVTAENLLTQTKGSANPGYMVESSNYVSFPFYQVTNREFEFCIKPSINIATGATYYFDLYQVGSGTPGVLTTFYAYPTLTTAASLPVELSSFSANKIDQGIELNWETATEVNNYGFEIEKKSGEKWQNIGFIEGAGNSNTAKSYSFSDNLTVPAGRQDLDPSFAEASAGRLDPNLTLSYRLKQIDLDGKFTYSKEVEVKVENVPTEFALNQNYPNPFNPTTTISYELPQESKVTLKIYNILGSEVATLVNKNQAAGKHDIKFNASNLSSGIYFYSIKAGNFTQTRKMILSK